MRLVTVAPVSSIRAEAGDAVAWARRCAVGADCRSYDVVLAGAAAVAGGTIGGWWTGWYGSTLRMPRGSTFWGTAATWERAAHAPSILSATAGAAPLSTAWDGWKAAVPSPLATRQQKPAVDLLT